LIAVLEHVNTVEPVLFVILAVGVVIFCVIVVLAVDVQPLELDTVTVYVPGAVILADADEPKLLLHEYEPPPVAVTLIAVFVHVNKVEPVLFVIPAVGAVISCVIVMLEVDVQPLAPVTVTV
jgi:hypothetical protein